MALVPSYVTWQVDQLVAQRCGIRLDQARGVCQLFEEGYEVAFVARYRVTQIGYLSCDEVRASYESYKSVKDLQTKANRGIRIVEANASGDELRKAVETLRQARDPAEIEAITQRYNPQNKATKASVARELGLEPAALAIFEGDRVELREFIGQKEALNDLKTVEFHVGNLLADIIDKQPKTASTVQSISNLHTRLHIHIVGELSDRAKKTEEEDPFMNEIKNFERYYNFSSRADRIEDFQILALERGEEKEVLSWKVEIKEPKREHPIRDHRVHHSHEALFQHAFSDSISRLFVPHLQRAIRRFLVNRAETSAINCFARNLRQLFAQAPLTGRHIIALDPGFKMCKIAFLTPLGEVLDTIETPFRWSQFNTSCVHTMNRWCQRLNGKSLPIIAIGNGQASKETQHAIARLIQEGQLSRGLQFCVVPETGASKYSVTQLAQEELPRMPPTLRSAISLGRRLIDPIGEYVKIEPKHLGVGMYQHSVPQPRLAEALNESVREAVSLRGVNVNTASPHLLEKVCGLDKTTAEGIVALRKKGPITNREALRKVQGMQAKSFEQCAGFLLIKQEDLVSEAVEHGFLSRLFYWATGIDPAGGEFDPLDATRVHPTQYPIAKKLLHTAQVDPNDLQNPITKKALEKLSHLDEDEGIVRDLLVFNEELTPPPRLQSDLRSLSSLSKGEIFWGRVSNNTDFGTFVDFGSERDGLVYTGKETKDNPPPVGAVVHVQIIEVKGQKVQLQFVNNY